MAGGAGRREYRPHLPRTRRYEVCGVAAGQPSAVQQARVPGVTLAVRLRAVSVVTAAPGLC
jgi:hypothetical protein